MHVIALEASIKTYISYSYLSIYVPGKQQYSVRKFFHNYLTQSSLPSLSRGGRLFACRDVLCCAVLCR